MSLYFITGIAGSGKSTVLHELRNQGYEAYDVDEAGPVKAKWQNTKTGLVHPASSIKQKDRTPKFLSEHEWIVPTDSIVTLAKTSLEKIVFLGGSIANETELRGHFSDVFALVLDDETVRHRLLTRISNDWGKNDHEMELTLKTNRELQHRYEKSDYVLIDAHEPVDKIISQILMKIHENK